MIRPTLIAGLVLSGLATVCSAQSSSSTSSSSDSSSAKEQQASAAPAKPQEPPPAEKKKPKKVWTNEELGTVKGGVSVVGDHSGGGGSSTAASSSAPSPSSPYVYTPPTNYDILLRRYLDKLAPLRADLADIDRNIQKAKDAMGNAREDTAAYIRVYQEKRRNILAKIEAIEDEARRRGVLPGDLR